MKQFTTHSGLTAATLILSVAVQPILAHSWVEQLMLIAANGTMTGAAGYMRGYVSRAVAGFSDSMDVYLLPPNGRSTGDTILATDPLCHPSQRSSNYSTEFPMLSVSAGDYIALRYQENGHVTLPDVNPTKPLNRGTVYIYGTAEPESEELFVDVFQKWTADGTGGNGRGRLLATRNYDDGQCYQVNNGAISTKRQTQFKKEAESPQGTDLWCQNDIQLPTDLAADSKYTLYWVWSWPTFNNAGSPTDIESPGFNVTTLQYYTSCVDVSVVASSSSGKSVAHTNNFASSFLKSQDLNSAAVLTQLEIGAFQVAVPGSTGSNSTTGNSGSGSSASTSAATGTATKASTATVAATSNASSAKGDHTVYVTVTDKSAPATVTVTTTAAGITGATITKSGGKTLTVTTEETVFVTTTVPPSSDGTGSNANSATATTTVTAPASANSSAAGSSKAIATNSTTTTVKFVPTPGQTLSVQPFLSASTTAAATTFKRVRRH